MKRFGAREIRLGLIGMAVLIVFLITAGSQPKPQPKKPVVWGYHGLPDFNVDPDAGTRELNALVARTHGDYTKLTYDEQVWIEALTANHGMEVLYKMALGADRQAAAARHAHRNAAPAAHAKR